MKMKKSKMKLNAVVGLEHIKDHRDSGINEAKGSSIENKL